MKRRNGEGSWGIKNIGKNKYHCHLSLSWVACWELKDNKIEVEVYYVGSRESAPY